jgi:hypothetical protein
VKKVFGDTLVSIVGGQRRRAMDLWLRGVEVATQEEICGWDLLDGFFQYLILAVR